MDDTYSIFVGIDWATEKHRVSIVDATGNRLDAFSIDHTADGIEKLLAKLRAHDLTRVAVGIERTDGAVVESLIDATIAVFSINPKQSDRFRDRHSVGGAKNDAFDAYVIADALRTDLKLFRRLSVADEQRLALREHARMHEELEKDLGRTRNRLYAQLLRYFPQALELLSPGADDPWVWALLKLAATPTAAAKLRPARIRDHLRTYRIRKWSADQVVEVLRKPALPVAPGVAEAAAAHVLVLVARLELYTRQKGQIDREMKRLLDEMSDGETEPGQHEHRDVAIVRSLPGVGTVVAATVLAEAHEALATRDYSTLRTVSGVAPVSRSTGKQERRNKRKDSPKGKRHQPVVQMRYACNARLRNALFYCAGRAAQNDEHFKAVYAKYRARNMKHGGALRRIGDQLLRILCGMLKTGTMYDLERPRRRAAPA